MAISGKTIKILWANAAGRCAFPGCRMKLCTDGASAGLGYVVGEMAHICGDRPNSNRHDVTLGEEDRDGYPNLLLLCPTHHTLIDKPENEEVYSVAVLRALKEQHEAWVLRRLEHRAFESKEAVARFLYPLMNENRQVFLAFGPTSQIARRNPSSDAYAIWLSERLSTIVPNNRRMADALEKYGDLFDLKEREILGEFLLHVRSYERWVREEASYEAVVRFPIGFDAMVTELSRASA